MYDNYLQSLNNVQVVPLQGGGSAGVSAIRIKSVPSVDSAGADKVTTEMEAGITSFLHSIHDFAALDISAELLMVNPAQQNGHSVELSVYLVFRALGDTDDQVGLGLSQLADTYRNLLVSGNYEVEEINPADDRRFVSDVSALDNMPIWAILKGESAVGSYTPVTSYYYQASVMPIGGADLKGIMSVLSNSPGTAFLAEIMPAYLSYDEIDAVEKVTFMLHRIANGIRDDYYGEIRDTLAERPFEYFDYYRNNSNALYTANIAVIGDPFRLKPVENEVIRAMTSGTDEIGNFSTETMHFRGDDFSYGDYFYTFPWNFYYRQQDAVDETSFWQRSDAPTTLHRMRFLYTAEEISKMIRVPFAENGSIAGIRVNKEERFETVYEDGVLNNDDNIRLGVFRSDNKTSIGISHEDLSKHMFITGVPGCGKTTFAQDMLYQLYKSDIPFLVIEPAKNEYRAMLDLIPDLQVFTPGKSEVSLFPINPFIPPKNVTVQMYKSNLMSAFEVAFDMEGPLRSLFQETIDNCYLEYGWRDSSTAERGGEPFGLAEFVKEFIANMKTKAYSPEVRNNIQTAGVVRLMNLININYSIFDVTRTIPVEDILNHPTIIELNAIENDSQKALITALLLTSIFAYTQNNISPEMYGRLNHVILLEEAHVLLSGGGSSRYEGGERENNTAVELINRILSEKRASGVGLIVADQSPAKVTPDVIRNTSSKVIFRTVDSGDREILASSVNMDAEMSGSLATLRPGSAYVFFEKIDRPVPVQTDNFRAKTGMRDTISDNEVRDKNSYWRRNPEISRPFEECMKNRHCGEGCDFAVRAEARFLVNYVCKKYGCNEQFSSKQFVTMCRELDQMIDRRISPDFIGERRDCVKRCFRVELLRKLFLTTELELSPASRMKLLDNPNF